MGISTLAQLRELAPKELQGASDAQLVVEFAGDLGRDPQEIAEYFGMSTGRDSGDFSAGISSGVDVVQKLGTSAAAGLADIVGAEDTAEYLRGESDRQGYEAYLAGKPGLDRVEDLDGIGDYIDYGQYQIGKQLPIMAGVAAGQLAVPGSFVAATGLGRAAAFAPKFLGGGGLQQGATLATQRTAQGLAQGEALAKSAMVGSGLGFGSLYDASAADGDPDPWKALLGAVPYGLAEAVVPAALTGAARIKTGAFTGTLPTRVTKAGAVSGVTEGATELFQTELEIGIDGTMTPEEAASQRLNAAVAGGVTGGALGTLGGIRKPAAAPKIKENELGEADLTASPTPTDATPEVDPSTVAAEQKRDYLASIKPEFSEAALGKMTRGDRIKLSRERDGLVYDLSVATPEATTEAANSGSKRQAKIKSKVKAKERAEAKATEIRDRIAVIDSTMAADKLASEAEANLSRIEQDIVPVEKQGEFEAAVPTFQLLDTGGADLTSKTSAPDKVAETITPTPTVQAPVANASAVDTSGLFDDSDLDDSLVSEADVAAIFAEYKRQQTLNASVSSLQGEAAKGATIDAGVFVGLVEMLRSSSVKPSPKVYKGDGTTAQDLEARNSNAEQMNSIYSAAMDVVRLQKVRSDLANRAASVGETAEDREARAKTGDTSKRRVQRADQGAKDENFQVLSGFDGHGTDL